MGDITMKCTACNAELSADAKFCTSCGAKIEALPPVRDHNPGIGLGVTSFVLGLLGLLIAIIMYCVCICAVWITFGISYIFSFFVQGILVFMSVAALILGIIAIYVSRRKGFKNGLGVSGIVLGATGIAFMALRVLYLSVGYVNSLADYFINLL